MKAIINGKQVEGTPSEILEYERLHKGEKPLFKEIPPCNFVQHVYGTNHGYLLGEAFKVLDRRNHLINDNKMYQLTK